VGVGVAIAVRRASDARAAASAAPRAALIAAPSAAIRAAREAATRALLRATDREPCRLTITDLLTALVTRADLVSDTRTVPFETVAVARAVEVMTTRTVTTTRRWLPRPTTWTLRPATRPVRATTLADRATTVTRVAAGADTDGAAETDDGEVKAAPAGELIKAEPPSTSDRPVRTAAKRTRGALVTADRGIGLGAACAPRGVVVADWSARRSERGDTGTSLGEPLGSRLTRAAYLRYRPSGGGSERR
jgi:hypothetical protein